MKENFDFDTAAQRARQALDGGSSGNEKIDRLISSLDDEDAKKLREALSDRKLAEKIISTKGAQEMLRVLLKNKGNVNG